MPWNAIDALSDARTATQSLLLPFDVGTWLRLAVVAFFVGTGTNASLTTNTGSVGSSTPTAPVAPGGEFVPPAGSIPALPPVRSLVALALGVAVLLFALFLAYAIAGAIFEYVFVVGVAERVVRIRSPFRSNVGNGLRLFGFKFALGFVVFAIVAVPLAAYVLLSGAAIGVELLLLGIPVLVLGVVAGLLALLVAQLTRDFVVPTMLVEGCGVLDGWRRVLPTMRTEWEEFALYVVLRVTLGILAGALLAVAIGLVALLTAVPFLLVGGLVAFALSLAGVAPFTLTGLALFGAVGLLYVAVLAVASLFVTVPVITYFRYYSLYFLGAVDAELDIVSETERVSDAGGEDTSGPTTA
jgi:hypothetical protein